MQIGGTRLVYASPGSGLIRAGKKIFGARVGKYKLAASAGKHKLGSRAGKYQLGARARAGGQAEGRRPSRGPGAGKYKYPIKTKYPSDKMFSDQKPKPKSGE